MALYPSEMWLGKASEFNREALERLCSISTLGFDRSTRKAWFDLNHAYKFAAKTPADTEEIFSILPFFKEYQMPETNGNLGGSAPVFISEAATPRETEPAQGKREQAPTPPSATAIAVTAVDKAASDLCFGLDNLLDLAEDLERRNENQRSYIQGQFKEIEDYQARILELEQGLDLSEGAYPGLFAGATPSASDKLSHQFILNLQNQLRRALHTQKILEREVEEYQQAYAELKAEASFDGVADEDLPPRLLELGHGEYLVYPAKVALGDDDEDLKWGVVIDSTTPQDSISFAPLVGKEVVLTEGDVAITFQKPDDVARLIQVFEDLRYRMIAEAMFEAT